MFVRRMPSSMIFFLMVIFFWSIVTSLVVAQTSTDSTTLSQSGAIGNQPVNQDLISDQGEQQSMKEAAKFDQDTLMELIYHGGTIGAITIFVLAVGLLIILMTRFKLGEDISNSEWVLNKLENIKLEKKTKLAPLTLFISDLKGKYEEYLRSLKKAGWGYIIKENINTFRFIFIKLGRRIMRKETLLDNPEDTAVKTTVFELLYKLYQVFDSTRDTDSFNSEMANYIQSQKDKFNPFQTVMIYLSDTAGALGLLGTVWGMFLTFFKGTMDQQEIMSGMGIALSTTIIGLVVSLILNTFTTAVSNKFDSHLETITKMANDLHIRLMKLGLKKRVEFQGTVGKIEGVAETDEDEGKEQGKDYAKAKVEIETAEEEDEEKFYPAFIEVLEGADQKRVVTSKLDTLSIKVRNKENIPLPGVKVYFSLDDSDGFLNGSLLKDDVETDDAGIAEVQWTLGEQSGDKYLSVKAEKYKGKEIKIKAVALPDNAEKISPVSGNYQDAPPGEELPKPFVVRVEDKYRNPIEKVAVTFKMIEGKGAFVNKDGRVLDERNRTCTVTTNKYGIAENDFILGQEQGVYKVTAETQGIDRKIEFQVFAKFD